MLISFFFFFTTKLEEEIDHSFEEIMHSHGIIVRNFRPRLLFL